MKTLLKSLLPILPCAALAVGCGGRVGSGSAAGSTGIASTSNAVTSGACPGGATVLGIDVSEFQGNVNWPATLSSGVRFGVARVGDGYYQDPYFDQNWSGMKAAGLLRGAYQFFEPGEDAVSQANIVVAKVGRLGPGDLPVMLDVEVTGGQSGATIAAKIHEWVNTVQAGTGKTPYIYTGAYFWDGSVGSGDFANLALNVAWYGTNCPGTPNAWNGRWAFHQFSSSASIAGVGGAVDADVFNGTEAQLQAFAGASSLSSTREAAFQANTGSLWTAGSEGVRNWSLGMMKGTSPGLAALPGGGFQVAFQANTGSLWTAGTDGVRNWSLGMMAGTSPSIAALPGGGFEVAFQANTGSLWTAGTDGVRNWSLGMMRGTSPSITALATGGFQVAFQANTGSLWTVGAAGASNWGLGMMSGTSPSIAGLEGGGFQAAFQANTSSLWTAGTAGVKNWGLGMMVGTSPSIGALPGGGFEVSFQANTSSLWTAGTEGVTNWGLGMMSGSSPSGM